MTDNEQTEYTVEYQDRYGVVYYRNVQATDIAEAKARIQQMLPDVTIRAVTSIPTIAANP